MNSLNLKNNKLSDVEFLKNINTLNGLDISYNQIARVPEFLANWINNKQIADILEYFDNRHVQLENTTPLFTNEGTS